jgi:endonuclease YncB( thermonuclease family)
MIRAALAIVIMALASAPAAADSLRGHARVVDGDTLWIGETKIRLAGIDAREKEQALGTWATHQLEDAIQGREIVCHPEGKGVYGRVLATCFPVLASGRVSAVSINHRMVRLGAAFAYGLQFERAQSLAMDDCAGVWNAAALPWCYRKGNR